MGMLAVFLTILEGKKSGLGLRICELLLLLFLGMQLLLLAILGIFPKYPV
jgi:hypothetical protein